MNNVAFLRQGLTTVHEPLKIEVLTDAHFRGVIYASHIPKGISFHPPQCFNVLRNMRTFGLILSDFMAMGLWIAHDTLAGPRSFVPGARGVSKRARDRLFNRVEAPSRQLGTRPYIDGRQRV